MSGRGISLITNFNQLSCKEGGETLESTVAALLLVTSTVVLSCFVVVYTVNTVTETFSGDSTTMKLIDQVQDIISNSTLTSGGTIDYIYPTPTPTATPTS
jgi:hypothetical protein